MDTGQKTPSVTPAHPPSPVTLSPCHLVTPSSFRAWFFLVWLSWQRQARMRQMVWIALGLLCLAGAFVAILTAADRWNVHTWRNRTLSALSIPQSAEQRAVEGAVLGGVYPLLDPSPFRVFTGGMVVAVFLSFLLPIWTLSFATEALGGERDSNSLIWLLSRPLPRPAVYLAKFVAVLPWVLVFNLGGYALLCLLAGPPGRQALYLFWPVMFWTTLAFTSLFYLIGAWLRRPAVIGILYVFFLEIILNLMPGFLKRISISFYARCMMFEAAGDLGIRPDNPNVFLPVSGTAALSVLIGLTMGLLVLGMILFTRTQYQDTV
jgi:ABC-2 type transport system permease protein